ncbi:MAG: hypothetical protein EOP49_41325, partial [Sphingobacteriales bacterium]
VYSWSNSNTAIGLAASGSGNIASFTAANSTSTVQTATITVTPSFTNGGQTCTGTPITFTITVNPTPQVTASIAAQTVCSGSTTTAIDFSTTTTGGTVSYDWTNSAATNNIGLATGGSGTIASFTALNSTNASISNVLTVTPTFTSGTLTCTGAPITVTITVDPIPSVNTPNNQVVCNGGATTPIDFSGPVSGTSYNWTNSDPTIGLVASGSGPIPSFTAVNNGTVPRTATIQVTPTTGRGFAYIANAGSRDLSVIEVATHTVVATIPMPGIPVNAALAPDGRKVYVPYGHPSGNGHVAIVDASTNTVVGDLAFVTNPHLNVDHITVSQNGDRVYVLRSLHVSSAYQPTLSVVNIATQAVISEVSLPGQAISSVLTPDGAFLYVTLQSTNEVAVINTATNSLVTTIPVINQPWTLAASPDGSKIYVS